MLVRIVRVPADAIVVRTDRATVFLTIRENENIRLPGQGKLCLGMPFEFTEGTQVFDQVIGVHFLSAQQNGSVLVKSVNHCRTPRRKAIHQYRQDHDSNAVFGQAKSMCALVQDGAQGQD